MTYPPPVPKDSGVGSAACYASVLLDDQLRKTLAAMNGADVGWVHGCVLDHGHQGDHGKPVQRMDGEPPLWLRWPDTGPARLKEARPPPPTRHVEQTSSPPNPPQPSPTPAASAPSRHAADAAVPTSGLQAEALWAIAAALERLADVASQLANWPRDNGLH